MLAMAKEGRPNRNAFLQLAWFQCSTMSKVYFWSHPQVPKEISIESAIFGGLSAPHNKDEHLFLGQSHHHVGRMAQLPSRHRGGFWGAAWRRSAWPWFPFLLL